MAPTSSAKVQAARSSSHTHNSAAHAAIKEIIESGVDKKLKSLFRTGKVRVVNYTPRGQDASFIPRMDLYEDPASAQITAVFELPGVSRAEISLNIRDGQLVVEGERCCQTKPRHRSLPRNPVASANTISDGEIDREDGGTGMNYAVEELRYGKASLCFRRTVPLPQGIIESDIKASLIEGMLTVSWPRDSRPPAARQIQSAGSARADTSSESVSAAATSR